MKNSTFGENIPPREKLSLLDPSFLSVSELLQIVLGHGTRKESVLDLSNRITNFYKYPELSRLTNVESFSKEYEISKNMACKVMAAVELGKRFCGKGRLDNLEQISEYFRFLAALKTENTYALYLDSNFLELKCEQIAKGSELEVAPPISEIVRSALQLDASFVVLAHNHAKGPAKPSKADIEFTKSLDSALKLFNIELFEHIICNTHGEIFSFKQHYL